MSQPHHNQCRHNKAVTDKINLESVESYTPEPVDQFIDYLIEGKETVIGGKEETNLNLIKTLHQELETRNLPMVNLVSFDGNPCNWPEFIADFKSRVHFKRSFSDNMHMERLLSVLKGEAKKSVESVSKSGIFYTTALKTLKRGFGNAFAAAYMKTKLLSDKPHLKYNDQISLKDFQQQLK